MKKINILFILLILFISFINLRSFFKPGIFRGHDLENHLARIANYYLAIKDKQIPPRWAGNLNYKFGYPVFNYNYPLANILAYPLIVIGLSIEDSLKLILFTAYFFSGLFFYLWLKKTFSSLAAFTGAIIYLGAPYVFLDLYVRGVVGENLSFALFPAILYFLKLLSEKISSWRFLGLIFTVALFSLSHNIMVLIFSPLLLIYWFYLIKSVANKQFFKLSLMGLGLGFLLTSFFWIPAIMEQKYVNLEAFNQKNFYQDHFVYLKQLIYSPWQYGFSVAGDQDTLSFQLGLASWIVIIISFILMVVGFKKRKKDWKIILVVQIAFWTVIFFMLPVSKLFWQIIPFIGYLQFPWRLLGLSIFLTSILAAIISNKHALLGVLLALISVIYAQQFTKPFLWDKKPDMDYYDFLFTTSTRHENMPRWFEENKTDQFKNRFISDSGLVGFREIKWLSGKHQYEIDVPRATTIWEHTAYFPGWQIFIDQKKTEIRYDNSLYPGLVGFNVVAGKHQILTKFAENTPARIIGDFLTIASGISTIFLFFKIKKTYA